MSRLKVQTFRNILYNCVTKGATLTCQTVTSSVVARGLTPADFGVVGFATIIIGFLGHFGDLGLGSAAVRSPNLDQRGIKTVFTLKFFLSFGAFSVAMLVAPFAHYFFQHSDAGNVIRFLSLNFLISTIGFLPAVALMRELNYKSLVLPGILSAIARCILSVTLVLCGFKYWAVVAADLGANLVSGLVMQYVKTVPWGFQFDRPKAEEYLRFGIPLVGTGILFFLLFNLDNFLVGTSMGSTQLGYYALAFNWSTFVCGLINDTVNNVLFPTFSAIQNDAAAMRRWYLKTVDLVAFISVVVNTTLLANAKPFLIVVLGKGTDKWVPAVMSLQILCLYGIVRTITEPLGNCMTARGKTKVMFQANLLAGVIEILLLLLALRSGKIETVALAVLLAYASQFIIYVPFLRNEFSIGFLDLAGHLWPLIPAIVAGYYCTSLLPGPAMDNFFTLACKGAFTATTVAVVHGLFTRFRCFLEARQLVSHTLAKVRG